MKLRKFIDCNIIDVLHEIMCHHTEHYQSDFEVDKTIFEKAALSDRSEDKHLLWLSYPCGTRCINERQAYIRETYDNSSWAFHNKTGDSVRAFAVEVMGVDGDKIWGNVYELNYYEHCNEIEKNEFESASVNVRYVDGSETELEFSYSWNNCIADKESILRTEYLPKDINRLNSVVETARKGRECSNAYEEWSIDALGKYYDEKLPIGATQDEFLNADIPAYAIYQLPPKSNNLFLDYGDYMENAGQPNIADYDFVYAAPLITSLDLEQIYQTFNIAHPEDYRGRSVSMGDVIVIKDSKGCKAYYVDTVGFKSIDNFFIEAQANLVKNEPGMEM